MNKSAQRNAQESRWDMEKSIHSGWNKNILKIFEKKREKLKINKPDSWTNEKWRAWRSTRVLTDSCCENVSFGGEFREADKVLASSQQLYSSREEKNQCKSVCEKRPQFPVIFWKIKDCINDKLRGKMQKNKGTSHQVWFFFLFPITILLPSLHLAELCSCEQGRGKKIISFYTWACFSFVIPVCSSTGASNEVFVKPA